MVLKFLNDIMNSKEVNALGIEDVKSQAVRKFRDGAEKQLLSLVPAISDQDKEDFLEEATSLVVDVFQAREQNMPFKELRQQKALALQEKKGDVFVHQPKAETIVHAPDLSKIPKWRGRKLDGMPLDFIKAHYGKWLTKFGAPEDAIYQDTLRKYDPKLLYGIENQLREERQSRKGRDKVRDFIKPRSARIDREVEAFTSDSLKHAQRLRAAMIRRQAKRQDPHKPFSQ